MPRVSMKTGFLTPAGAEEVLTEDICDWPDCPNVATHVMGCIKELRTVVVVCDQHTAKPETANAPVRRLPRNPLGQS